MEMEQHPMAESVPMIIGCVGVEAAIRWWLIHAIDWPTPEAIRMSIEAVSYMAVDDIDRIVCADDGEQLARAFQWVGLFSLEPFVEASRVAPTA